MKLIVTGVKKGSSYKDGGSYDVLGKINGKSFKYFRNASSINGDGKLYTHSNMNELVPENIAKLITLHNI